MLHELSHPGDDRVYTHHLPHTIHNQVEVYPHCSLHRHRMHTLQHALTLALTLLFSPIAGHVFHTRVQGPAISVDIRRSPSAQRWQRMCPPLRFATISQTTSPEPGGFPLFGRLLPQLPTPVLRLALLLTVLCPLTYRGVRAKGAGRVGSKDPDRASTTAGRDDCVGSIRHYNEAVGGCVWVVRSRHARAA